MECEIREYYRFPGTDVHNLETVGCVGVSAVEDDFARAVDGEILVDGQRRSDGDGLCRAEYGRVKRDGAICRGVGNRFAERDLIVKRICYVADCCNDRGDSFRREGVSSGVEGRERRNPADAVPPCGVDRSSGQTVVCPGTAEFVRCFVGKALPSVSVFVIKVVSDFTNQRTG